MKNCTTLPNIFFKFYSSISKFYFSEISSVKKYLFFNVLNSTTAKDFVSF
ncbi:hypothetical protein RU92_GL001389 [Lactococcus cremoris subsp. tructae]|uniref:Uncharacterized protein n=1 Tax=Lactococcus cremoris subsp. tructae TaxID=542833 RepID=A0A2A5SVH0_LACLC|nr:hypothetical protein RU92_GL001389 [Lactococcus cremoris subsp. tructae]